MTIYPVALCVAWDLWEKAPEATAPRPRASGKVGKGAAKTKKLLGKRRRKNKARLEADSDKTDGDEDSDDIDSTAEDLDAPSRNYHDHYLNSLRFCAAIRIIVSQEISADEAERGQTFLSQAFASWAEMRCHLTPNFHRGMHILEYILAYGPVYGWWVFCYERFIGMVGKFNNNGHGGGELEATIMRGWWKTIRCQELVCGLLCICCEDRAVTDMPGPL